MPARFARAPFPPRSNMQLTIEKLVYGGDGLARTDQGVIFVPRTAAGDVVEAEITEKKKDYSTAHVTKLLQPSPDRQTPYCPNYETEGCCHWQHIRYDKQVDYKEAIIRESLKRVGHLDWNGEIHRVTGPDRNYRLRASFHVFGRRLGFVHGPIQQCAALVPVVNAFIPTVDASNAKEVIAIESNRAAVRQARDNAAANKTPSIQFVDGQVDAAIRGTDLKPDVVVMDPPRAGCGVKVAEQ